MALSGFSTSLKWKSGCASWVALRTLRGSAPASGGGVDVLPERHSEFFGLSTSLRWKNGCASWTALQILRGSAPASGGRVGIITPPTLRPEDGPRKPSVCECGRDRHTHLMRMVGASDNSDRCKGQHNLMRRAVLLRGSMSHLWKA